MMQHNMSEMFILSPSSLPIKKQISEDYDVQYGQRSQQGMTVTQWKLTKMLGVTN